jgi:tetratricopeptide (TPR) repeat protein
MKQSEAAIGSFREALRINPACEYCRYELAEQLAATGETREAESLLRKVVGSVPGNAAAQYLLGKLLASRGEAKEAIAALEAAVASDPNNERAWYQLGKQYSEALEPVKAKSAFDEVRRIQDQRRSAAESRIPKVAP